MIWINFFRSFQPCNFETCLNTRTFRNCQLKIKQIRFRLRNNMNINAKRSIPSAIPLEYASLKMFEKTESLYLKLKTIPIVNSKTTRKMWRSQNLARRAVVTGYLVRSPLLRHFQIKKVKQSEKGYALPQTQWNIYCKSKISQTQK